MKTVSPFFAFRSPPQVIHLSHAHDDAEASRTVQRAIQQLGAAKSTRQTAVSLVGRSRRRAIMRRLDATAASRKLFRVVSNAMLAAGLGAVGINMLASTDAAISTLAPLADSVLVVSGLVAASCAVAAYRAGMNFARQCGSHDALRERLRDPAACAPLPLPDVQPRKTDAAAVDSTMTQAAATAHRVNAWGLLRGADGSLKQVRDMSFMPPSAPSVTAQSMMRDMLKNWCSTQIGHLRAEHARTHHVSNSWVAAGARLAQLNARLAQLDAIHGHLAVSDPFALQAAATLIDTLIVMDLFRPFALAALRNKAVRDALQKPRESDYYWLEAERLVERLAALPSEQSKALTETLHRLAHEILWGPGAFMAARDEANMEMMMPEPSVLN